ncbi:MAG TPA: hypothetical protein VF507_06100, partial [Pyrinomonadaceae bacterium]
MSVGQIKERVVKASAVRAQARAPRWAVPATKAVLVAADVLVAASCFVGAFYVREGGPVLGHAGQWWSRAFAPYAAVLLFVLPIRLLALAYYDLYRLRGEFSLVDDAVRVFKAAAIGSLLIVAAAFLYRGGFQFRAFSYARGVFVLDFFLALTAFGLVRLLENREALAQVEGPHERERGESQVGDDERGLHQGHDPARRARADAHCA